MQSVNLISLPPVLAGLSLRAGSCPQPLFSPEQRGTGNISLHSGALFGWQEVDATRRYLYDRKTKFIFTQITGNSTGYFSVATVLPEKST